MAKEGIGVRWEDVVWEWEKVAIEEIDEKRFSELSKERWCLILTIDGVAHFKRISPEWIKEQRRELA